MVSFSIRPSGGGPLATVRRTEMPYDAEVEYVESDGTQWIDTGFKATGGCVIECRLLQGDKTTNGFLVGSHNPSNNSSNGYNRLQCGIAGENDIRFSKCDKYEPFQKSFDVDAPHTFVFDTRGTRRRGVFDGDVVVDETTSMTLSPVNDIVVFYSQYNSRATPGKVYYLKLTDADGKLVRDMVPVRFTNSSGQSEGALYDRVTGELFKNKGAGSFQYGDDVRIPDVCGYMLPTLRKYKVAASYIRDPRNGDSPSTVRCLVPGEWELGIPNFPEHRLIGWYTAPNDTSDESGAPPAGASKVENAVAMDLPLPETVYACWQHKALVVFDPNLQGASVDMIPELYVGDPLTNVINASVTAPSESGAVHVGWSANVVHAPSRRLIDVDPGSVQGGINYDTQEVVASGDVYYALWLLPAQVTLDLNASSVDSSFDPSLDGTPNDYYENSLYFYIPEASDPMRDDVRFAFWTRDASPAASYDPWQSMVTQIDPSMDMPTDGETLYAVWQNAVPVRFLGCTDPIVYVFEGENLPDQLPEPAPGYVPQGAVFDGWEDSYQSMDVHEGDPVYSSYISNDLSYPGEWTLTPKWAYAVSVTFDATTNGGSMPSGWVPPEYYSGRPYGTLPTPTHPTLSFAGWYDGSTLVKASSIVPAGGANLVAEYAAQSYSVDLNSEWRVVDPMDADASGETTPTELAGCDHFESASNYGVRPTSQTYDPSTGSYVYSYNKSECASMTISVVGYNEFTIYVRASPSSYESTDYIAVVLADNGIPQQPESDDDYYNGNIRVVQYYPPDDPNGGYSYDVSDNPWYFINYVPGSAMVQETFQSQWGESTRQAGVDTWPWVKEGLPSEETPLDGSGVFAMTYEMICQERLDQDYMGDASQLDEYMARPPQGMIEGYIPVTVQLPDSGPHDIVVMYKKGVDDWSGDYYLSQYGTKDRGFVIIPPGGQPL